MRDEGGNIAQSLGAVRGAAVFMAVVVAFAIVRFFQAILAPLVIATFLLLLADALSRILQERLPTAPRWARSAIAATAILIAFIAIGLLFAIQAPSFAMELRGLAPRIDDLLAKTMVMVGAPPMKLRQIRGVDPGHVLGRAFATARGLISYAGLVIIYFGFLQASRAAFGRKLECLYTSDGHRQAVLRVADRVRDAVERYVKLQTLKAGLVAIVAGVLCSALGVNDALFVAFVVFLTAYIPIVGPAFGAIFPGLAGFAQFDDLLRPLTLLAVVGLAAALIDNVLIPKLASDELNIDPLLVLISIGFWGAILGMPGVLLSTPLTVTVLAITAEFESTRWLAILLSRDGLTAHEGATVGPGDAATP